MATRQWLSTCKHCGHDFTISLGDVSDAREADAANRGATADEVADRIDVCKPCALGPEPKPDPLDPEQYDAAAREVAKRLREVIYEQDDFQDTEMDLLIENRMVVADYDDEGDWQKEYDRATDAVYEQLFPPVTLAKRLIGFISAFDEACTNNEETDIGEAWDLLYEIRSTLSRLADPRIENERENQGASWRTTTKEVPSG